MTVSASDSCLDNIREIPPRDEDNNGNSSAKGRREA